MNLSRRRTRLRGVASTGATAIIVGLLVLGGSSYAFLVVAARALGPDRFAPLSTLWAIVFILGPGLFLPMEQEVARTIAERKARGEGGGPVVRTAAMVASVAVIGFLLLGALAKEPLTSVLFDGEPVLLGAVGLSLVGFAAAYVVRGGLSANGLFGSYGAVLASEGVLRVGIATMAWLLGSRSLGLFAVALAIAPLASILIFMRDRRTLLAPGAPITAGELMPSLGHLLAASALSQVLVNAGPVAVTILASPGEEARVSQFLVALVVSRVPLFLFQAIQATFLPELAALAGASLLAEFRRRVARTAAFVLCLGSVGIVVGVLVGPDVIRFLFGRGFVLGNVDIGLLAISSGAFLMAVVLAQPLIALGAHRGAAGAWFLGVACFLSALLVRSDVLLRVELALVAGCASGALAMGVVLRQALRRENASRPTTEASGKPHSRVQGHL